jgi:hypothetical protein
MAFAFEKLLVYQKAIGFADALAALTEDPKTRVKKSPRPSAASLPGSTKRSCKPTVQQGCAFSAEG